MNLTEWKESGLTAKLFGHEEDERLHHRQLDLAVQEWIEDRMVGDGTYDEEVRAICQRLDDANSTVPFKALDPDVVTDDWFESTADVLLDNLMQHFDDEYCCAGDDPTEIVDDDHRDMEELVRRIVARKHVYNCHDVATIELTGADIVSLVVGPPDARILTALGIPATLAPWLPEVEQDILRDKPAAEADVRLAGCVCGAVQDEPHTCPYAEEINNDTSLCTCCEECAQRCADDI